MKDNTEALEARGVSLTKTQWDRCDRLAENYNKKSRNAFIREAVDFYCAWLERDHIEKFLTPALESVIGAKILKSEERIRNLDFKLAVQIAILSELMMNYFNYSDEDIELLREDAVRHVKETNGSFRF